jgi:hypothetical protein
VTMKNAVFWGLAACRCGRLNRRFGGSYRLHLQGRKIRERRTSVSRYPEDGGDTILRNVGSTDHIYTAPNPRRRHSSTVLLNSLNTKLSYLLADRFKNITVTIRCITIIPAALINEFITPAICCHLISEL